MDGTPGDVREALLQSPTYGISYESFTRPPAPKHAQSFAASSCTDAQSYISSETTVTTLDSTSGPKTKAWLANIPARAWSWLSSTFRRGHGPRQRCKGYDVVDRLRHVSSAPGRLVHASLVVLIGLGAAVVAYVADMGESHIFDWKFGLCAGDWTATKALCCSGCEDQPR